jgi:hypothetical protein
MGVTQQTVGIDSCPMSVTGTVVRMVCGDRKIWGVGARVGGGWVVGRIGLPSGYGPLVNGAETLVFAGVWTVAGGIAKHLQASSRAERGVWWGGRGVELRRGVGYYDALRQTENSAIALLDGAVAKRAGEWLTALGCPKIKKRPAPPQLAES